MERFAVEVIDRLKDPILILLGAVIAGLFYLVIRKDKSVEAMQGMTAACIRDNTAAMARLVTMIEGLVHGRKNYD